MITKIHESIDKTLNPLDVLQPSVGCFPLKTPSNKILLFPITFFVYSTTKEDVKSYHDLKVSYNQKFNKIQIMKQYKNHADLRHTKFCVYCGSAITEDNSTRDHVPSKVLLDKPFPQNLPVVPSCHTCNNNFSQDEEYIAYWIETLLQIYEHKETYIYEKLKRAFKRNSKLKGKILGTNLFGSNELLQLNESKLNNVLIKLAKGHAFFELNNPKYEKPTYSNWNFIRSLNQNEIERFIDVPYDNLISPEVGSRSLNEIGTWQIVQKNRYVYLALETVDVTIIKIILNDFLLYEARWEDRSSDNSS